MIFSLEEEKKKIGAHWCKSLAKKNRLHVMILSAFDGTNRYKRRSILVAKSWEIS